MKNRLTWNVGATHNASSHLFTHYTGTPPSTADLTTYANLIASSYSAHMISKIPNNVVLSEIECLDLGNPGTIAGVAPISIPGTFPTTAMTAETAVLINFTIARRYRGGKPRVYWPAGTSADLASPVAWQGTFISGFESAFTAFLTALAPDPTPPPAVDHLVNVSYFSAHVLRPTPVVDQVLSWAVNPIPGSQRRRMGR
jgi:hypothetical protein